MYKINHITNSVEIVVYLLYIFVLSILFTSLLDYQQDRFK